MFFKLRCMLRRGRREDGAVTVEFALCLIPLLLIVGGIIDFGESWYMQSVLATGSREGARYATRYQTSGGVRTIPNALNPTIQDYVLKTSEQNGGADKPGYGLRTILSSDANPAVPTPLGAGYATGTTGLPVSVTVTAEKHWLFLNRLIPGLSDPQVLSSTTTMSCE